MNNIDNITLSTVLNVYYENKPCYNIIFKKDFNDLIVNLNELNIKNRRIMIVSETNVAPLYLDELKNLLNNECVLVKEFIFEAGEQSKNIDTVSRLYEELIINKFDRNDLLLALGGGVVGDLTGFTASTYLRGVDFVQIPTTLLSQVDSSVGGKTGVDFKAYKNMVGAFYQPKLVYINISTLNTLTDSDFNSGMAEVIKYGLINNKDFFEWLKQNVSLIKERNIETLTKMIYICCNAKREVVERDPKEKGERALLNLGHTIGHAVEKTKDFQLLHGECVAIGINAASQLSYNKGYISIEVVESIKNVLLAYDLPINTAGIDVDDVVNATLNDKKMSSGIIKFISIKGIGESFIDTTVSLEDIKKVVSETTIR